MSTVKASCRSGRGLPWLLGEGDVLPVRFKVCIDLACFRA